METSTYLWLALGFVSVVALIYTFAVGITIIWRVCLVGIVIGLLISTKAYYNEVGFDWMIALKGAIIGSVAGTVISFFKRN